MKQTRQAVRAIKQSIILRCLWVGSIKSSPYRAPLWGYLKPPTNVRREEVVFAIGKHSSLLSEEEIDQIKV